MLVSKATRTEQKTVQQSFVNDPTLSDRLFDLLDTIFPGVRQVARNARALGASWESVSTPFLVCEGERVLSHVGVIKLSLIVLGEKITVGSIHGVATHPDYRRRGYYRQVIEEALRYCGQRYATQILTTEHPEYFEPFGFRVVQEHGFTVQYQPARHGNEIRTPVSQIVGVVNEKAVFCFNEGSRSLYYADDLDVILCLEQDGSHLKLFDVVGPHIPSLAAIVDCIPQTVEEVTVCFSPDQLGVNAKAKPYLFDHDGPSYFMVRGPFKAEGQAFTLPRSART
jgi:N-acetylglutamate synthase-like GNAT family acetyltransferase